jgi:ArsR family transcriptional regulator
MLMSSLRKTAESHLAETDRLKNHLASADTNLAPWTSRKLFEQSQKTEIVLLDIRPRKEFAQGHITGAINIPPQEIQQRLDDIPRNKTIVAYCRGPYCQYSYEIEHALQQEGVEIHRLEEGFPEWKAAGLPYETMPEDKPSATR